MTLTSNLKVILLSGGDAGLKNMQRNRYHKNVSQGILTWELTSDEFLYKSVYDKDYYYLAPRETAVILHGSAEYAAPHDEL